MFATRIEPVKTRDSKARTHRLPADTTQQALLSLIDELNRDKSVHGILVQLPLPAEGNGGQGFDERAVLDAIDPLKDVDAFSPVNVGLLMQGRPRFLPCTPHGIVQLLASLQDQRRRQARGRRRAQRYRWQADGNDVGPA